MKTKKIYWVLSLLMLLVACTTSKNVQVTPDNQALDYVGRINFENPQSPEIYWSGSSVSINFKGSAISAKLVDEYGLSYFNVVIDNDSVYPLKLTKDTSSYVLADSLDANIPHTISLVKRNEWVTGKTQLLGFDISHGEILPASPKRDKLIEFYGNSITAGYAIENLTGGDSPDSTYTNNYKTYAALTARHFNADLHCIVRSGIGIQVSWDRPIMPEIYNRLNPVDSTSLWDFSKVTPDLVVINLMQNDKWLVELPNYKEFKYRFGTQKPDEKQIIDAYADFVASIRKEYPSTPIICALGSMDATQEGSLWPGYVEKAVEQLQDENIYTHFFPFINKGGHPRVADDEKMAASLIDFIEDTFEW